MPLFGKRRREPPKAIEDREAMREAVKQAVGHTLAIRSLWRDGRIDMDIRGNITDDVLITMTDVHDHWLRIAAYAWRGYELLGRGLWYLNSTTRLSGYLPTASVAMDHAPRKTGHYCERYSPEHEVVIMIFDFTEEGDPGASASLWVRPPETWTSPPDAWRQLDPAMKSSLDRVLRSGG